MSAHQLYDTWFRRIRELWPQERITRQRNLAWMVVAMYLSQSVHLPKMASKVPLGIRRRSIEQRFSRFLQNKHFRVRDWYAPVAQQLLCCAAAHGSVHLIIDSTPVGRRYQLLMVGLAYRKRALPLAWSWLRGKRGHSSAAKQRALLNYVRELLPAGATVVLVGDNEFGSIEMLRQLEQWGWYYVLRQKSNVKVCVSTARKWQSFGELVPRKEKVFWYPQTLLTAEHLHRTSLLAFWRTGEEEPWLLASNLPGARETLRAYRRRVWLDEFFGDVKGHGVDLAKTRLWHFQRLSRLLFIVALLYLWLVTRGSQAIKKGQRALVDRRDRRDHSIFRIGWDFAGWLLAHNKPFAIRLSPYF